MDHIIASFHIAQDVAEPKVRGVNSSYSPLHKFAFVDWLASGRHAYGDAKPHYPGETLEVRIAFASWEHLRDHMKVGDRFDVLELDRLVGHGVVTEILDTPR